MSRNRFLAAAVFLSAVLVSPVLAQGPATPPRPAAPQSGNVPISKIAVIYSGDFQDPKTGIARFIATLNKLNAEYQPIEDGLKQTSLRLRALQEEINKLQNTVPAVPRTQIQTKIEQLDQQKKDYTRRGEDAQRGYQGRRQELFVPLQQEISKALDTYAKSRGITMVIDGSQVPLVYAAESIDITKAFISDYNSRNPATTAVTTPK